ncbi:MAG: hypothetical protein QMC70_08875, partial [Bacteroidia bacterium]
MKQIIKIASVLFILFILVAASIVFYFHQNIKPILISEINNTLAVEVAVEEITISGLRDFPNLGIKLAKVSIDESTPYYKEKLLVADELNLFVDVWKLYKGEYVIDKVVLRGGKLRIADLNYGTNYDITKPRTDDGTIVSFEIKDLKLVNCDVLYEHRPSKFKCNTYTSLSTIALKYIEKASYVSIVAELNKTDVVSGGEKYIVEKDLKINTEIAINPDEQIVTIAPSDLQIQEVKLKAEGMVNYSETSAVDIRFSNANTTAQSLFSILPAHFVSSLDNIDLNGDVVINGFFKGKTYGTNDPALGFNYALKKATV